MRHFLQFIVERLAAFPADCDIRELPEERGTTYQLVMHPEDVGRVIGKQGRTIQAIRSLAAAAAKPDQRVLIEVVEAA